MNMIEAMTLYTKSKRVRERLNVVHEEAKTRERETRGFTWTEWLMVIVALDLGIYKGRRAEE